MDRGQMGEEDKMRIVKRWLDIRNDEQTTLKDFARGHGICPGSLSKWVRKYGGSRAERKTKGRSDWGAW